MPHFIDFPYDFDPANNLFRDAIREIGLTNELDDLFFIGCYTEISFLAKSLLFIKSRVSEGGMTEWLNHQRGLSRLKSYSGRKVWVTFENRRIPHEDADLTISFDLDSNFGSNLYFPLLFSYIDFLETKASYVRHQITFEELLSPREDVGKSLDERKFACAFINNPDPVRLRFINEMSKFGKVDLFGRYTKNYVGDKIGIGNDYKFIVCFENDLYPGYVTEKPLEAWLSRAVPIYWGDDAKGILNSSAIINCTAYESLASAAKYVASLETDTRVLKDIINQPLLSSLTEKPDLVGFLKQILL